MSRLFNIHDVAWFLGQVFKLKQTCDTDYLHSTNFVQNEKGSNVQTTHWWTWSNIKYQLEYRINNGGGEKQLNKEKMNANIYYILVFTSL